MCRRSGRSWGRCRAGLANAGSGFACTANVVDGLCCSEDTMSDADGKLVGRQNSLKNRPCRRAPKPDGTATGRFAHSCTDYILANAQRGSHVVSGDHMIRRKGQLYLSTDAGHAHIEAWTLPAPSALCEEMRRTPAFCNAPSVDGGLNKTLMPLQGRPCVELFICIGGMPNELRRDTRLGRAHQNY